MSHPWTQGLRPSPLRRGGMEMQIVLPLLLLGAFCYSAWLTSIVFCAANGCRPLLLASAASSRSGLCMVSVFGSEVGSRRRRVHRQNLDNGYWVLPASDQAHKYFRRIFLITVMLI